MQIYINKNGQQLGPFEDKVVLGMIKNGQVSANDLAIRQNDRQWQTLSAMFPEHFPTIIPTSTLPPMIKPPMKKRFIGGIYVVSLVLLIVGLVAAAPMAAVAGEGGSPGLLVGSITIASLAYLQFLVVHTVIMFYILFKMWDSIQDGFSTSTAKAIGFLFIPFFSIYWIFKAWGGFPNEYNLFIERHHVRVPPLTSSVYLLVPVFTLLSGLLILPVIVVPFIFMALISQTCDAVNWLNKGLENKIAGISGDVTRQIGGETLLSPVMKIAVFGLGGISVLALIGMIGFGWWNLNPKPGSDDLPATVGSFSKTQMLMNKGNMLGNRKQFGALYETADKKKAIVYDVRNATKEYEKTLNSYAHTKKGDVTDSSGNKIGEFAFGKGNLEIYNGSKRILIWDINQATPSYILPYNMSKEGKITSLTEAELLEFAKTLPINSQLKFSEASVKTTTTTTTSTTNLKGGREISATEKADFTMTSEEFYALTKKSDTTQYLGKVFDITGRVYMLSSPKLKANIYDMFDINMSSKQTNTNLKEDELLKLKCVGVTEYSRLELGNCLILENKGIMTAEGAPDFTVTADEYQKNTQNVVNKYRNKVIDITGKVKLIGGKGEYLVTTKSWLTCYPLKGKESDFQNLTEGAEVKFRGLGDVSGLKHCIVISR